MRGLHLRAAAISVACAQAVPAAAEIAVAENETACFGRAYPWEEVDAAPPRRAMWLWVSLTNWDGDLYFGFNVAFIDRPGPVFNAGGLCHPREAGYMCANDGDGGVIHVAPMADGGITVRGNEYGSGSTAPPSRRRRRQRNMASITRTGSTASGPPRKR